MSALNGKTMYRVVIGIEEYDVVNGIEKTPETISNIAAKNDKGPLEFKSFTDAKSQQIKLSGFTMEAIPDHE